MKAHQLSVPIFSAGPLPRPSGVEENHAHSTFPFPIGIGCGFSGYSPLILKLSGGARRKNECHKRQGPTAMNHHGKTSQAVRIGTED